MTIVAVSGSNFDTRIAVTNFINPGNAPTIFVDTGFTRVGDYQGCVVAASSLYTNGDLTGSLVAVGHYGGGQVLIYDVSNPTAPTVLNTYDTGLGALTGIGCISLYGTYLLVGELNGPTIVLIDISQPPSAPPVSTLTCPEFAHGGISSIALSDGLLAAAAGPYGFDLLNYATPTAPTRQPYVGNIEGPFTCDFDGENIAIGAANGILFVFQVSDGLLPEFPSGQSASDQNSITSIAVMSGDVVQVAAGNFSAPQVTLASFRSEMPGPPPPLIGSIFLGSGAGNAGGALAFYGLANLFASTNDGLGVTWYYANWPSDAPVVAPPFIVAPDANLASASVPTLAITAFEPPPQIWFGWVWNLFPPWLQQLLLRLYYYFRG